jgi:hypothetical protein
MHDLRCWLIKNINFSACWLEKISLKNLSANLGRYVHETYSEPESLHFFATTTTIEKYLVVVSSGGAKVWEMRILEDGEWKEFSLSHIPRSPEEERKGCWYI